MKEKMEQEKWKLYDLIRPAIMAFIKETGAIPTIQIITKESKTQCATFVHDPEIIIKAIF